MTERLSLSPSQSDLSSVNGKVLTLSFPIRAFGLASLLNKQKLQVFTKLLLFFRPRLARPKPIMGDDRSEN